MQRPPSLHCALVARPPVVAPSPQIIDPALPTSARAGSPEKIEVIIARKARRLPLFHPDDNPRIVNVEGEQPWWVKLWPDIERLDDEREAWDTDDDFDDFDRFEQQADDFASNAELGNSIAASSASQDGATEGKQFEFAKRTAEGSHESLAIGSSSLPAGS